MLYCTILDHIILVHLVVWKIIDFSVEMKREGVPGVALGGLGHKPYHGLDARLEQPIKLTKPLNTSPTINEEEEDDDDDRLRLVIAHRENTTPEDSDHESSESAEHSV